MIVALGVVALLVFSTIGIGVAVAARSGGSTQEAGYNRYSQLPTTTRQLPSRTAPPTTTRFTPTTTVPAEPQPVPKLGDHPINRSGLGLPKVDCDLGAFATDAASQDRFYRAAIGCLDRAWQPVLEEVDLPFSSPTLQTITGPTETPCGNRNGASETAYYCGRNHTIYMSAGHYPQWYKNRMGAYLKTIAHEYGHHVQGVTGILGAAWDARYEAGADTPKGQELNRRMELQANCYAGMFFTALRASNSISQDTVDQARSRLNESTPQSPTHGSRDNYGGWFFHGMEHNRTHECNTWTSDAAHVS